jgi:hypothetical protein
MTRGHRGGGKVAIEAASAWSVRARAQVEGVRGMVGINMGDGQGLGKDIRKSGSKSAGGLCLYRRGAACAVNWFSGRGAS